MNAKELSAAKDALGVISNLEGQLGNFLKRGPAAIKEWGADYERNPDPAAKKKLKDEVIAGAKKLLTTAKTAYKDLGKFAKEGADAKKLAKFPSGKEFRAFATKSLASSKSFDEQSMQFLLTLMSVLGAGMYPGMSNVDCQAVVNSINTYSKYYNAIRIELAKV